MTTRPDLYAILGVLPNSTQAEIVHAYRSLLHQHHPDTRDPVDESQSALSDAALQQVIAAYAVLRDPVRRADYDQHTKPRPRPVPRPRQQGLNAYYVQRQPPIVAGPVRWHRAPDPPAR